MCGECAQGSLLALVICGEWCMKAFHTHNHALAVYVGNHLHLLSVGGISRWLRLQDKNNLVEWLQAMWGYFWFVDKILEIWPNFSPSQHTFTQFSLNCLFGWTCSISQSHHLLKISLNNLPLPGERFLPLNIKMQNYLLNGTSDMTFFTMFSHPKRIYSQNQFCPKIKTIPQHSTMVTFWGDLCMCSWTLNNETPDFAKISLLTSIEHGCVSAGCVFQFHYDMCTLSCCDSLDDGNLCHLQCPPLLTHVFQVCTSLHFHPCHLSHQIHLTLWSTQVPFYPWPCHCYFHPHSPTQSLHPLQYPLPYLCPPMIVHFPLKPLRQTNKSSSHTKLLTCQSSTLLWLLMYILCENKENNSSQGQATAVTIFGPWWSKTWWYEKLIIEGHAHVEYLGSDLLHHAIFNAMMFILFYVCSLGSEALNITQGWWMSTTTETHPGSMNTSMSTNWASSAIFIHMSGQTHHCQQHNLLCAFTLQCLWAHLPWGMGQHHVHCNKHHQTKSATEHQCINKISFWHAKFLGHHPHIIWEMSKYVPQTDHFVARGNHH